MNDDILDAFLAAVPLPCLAIDGSERIAGANSDALTLIGQKARGQNYVTMLRQPALLEAIETTLADGMARSTQYLSNDGSTYLSYLCLILRSHEAWRLETLAKP